MAPRSILTLTFVALVGLTACGASHDDSGSADSPADDRMSGEASSPMADTGDGEADRGDAPTTAGAPTSAGALGQQLAIEAGVTIATPDVRRAVDDTLDAVARRGGFVQRADVRLDTDDPDTDRTNGVGGSAYVVVRIAPTELEPLIDELDGLAGTLTGRTQGSEDVADQLTDLEIRIRVERNTIARYEELLATATEFDDVVAIERVITERTVELERLLAAERNLDDRVALSTLTIELVHVPAAGGDDGSSDDGIADAFAAGWEAFVGGLFIVAFVAAVIAPFAAVAALVVLGIWALTRLRSRSAGPGRPTAGPTGRDQHEIVDATVGEGERSPHAGVGDDHR